MKRDDRDAPGGQPTGLTTRYLRLKGALFDPNTELNASPAVLERVRALFHHSRSIGVLQVEVDPASRIEEVYGWQVLDDLLRSVARALERLRVEGLPPDSVLCQTGIHSDRFLIFVTLGHGSQEAQSAILRATSLSVQETLQRLFGGEEFRSMTPGPAVRIGSAIVREYPFFRLERQIYRGVEEARVNASRADVPDRERWQTELKRIIRDRAIETLFQPLVDLDRGSIIGYEAFSRGPHASDFEMPDHLFERSRQIGMSGELDRICQRAALKKARGLGSQDKLFINALPDSLSDPCFREALLAGLPEDFPVCRNNIVLEIADRHMVRDCEAFSTEVNDLRAQGFRMSIDDVGKSSTSLESLTELRPDFIKVDGSLIRNIHKNLIKQELVRSLCHAAGTMNAQIIAEGIETREELSVARQCGARIGQGYFFYRPSREIPVRRIKRDRAGM